MTSPCACYLRVSTSEQDHSNQRAEVEALARARGFEPVFYEESAGATKSRPVFDRMMADVSKGKVAAIAVWSIDRLHRNMTRLLTDVGELARLNVRLLSAREGWIDVEGPTRSLLTAIMGWVAEFERTRLIERTKAGLARARREGKRLGRPPASPISLRAAADLVARGVPVAEAARAKGVHRTSLRRHLAQNAMP